MHYPGRKARLAIGLLVVAPLAALATTGVAALLDLSHQGENVLGLGVVCAVSFFGVPWMMLERDELREIYAELWRRLRG